MKVEEKAVEMDKVSKVDGVVEAAEVDGMVEMDEAAEVDRAVKVVKVM